MPRVVGQVYNMRITCPNCDAQYEVPTSVIPTEGRDVECSNCGQTWYQYHPDHPAESVQDAPDEGPEGEDAATPTSPPEAKTVEDGDDTQSETASDVTKEAPPAPQPQPRRRRELDPGVADILREEAAREQAARAAEPLEMQTDLNLDPAGAASPPPARSTAPKPRSEASSDFDPNSLREPTSRRELLPDIEEINSTLRSTADRDAAGDDLSPDAPIRTRQKRSFRRGFVVSMALMAIASLVYSFAPQLTDAVPQAELVLESYTAAVDDARIWLNGHVTTFTKWLETQAAALQS